MKTNFSVTIHHHLTYLPLLIPAFFFLYNIFPSLPFLHCPFYTSFPPFPVFCVSNLPKQIRSITCQAKNKRRWANMSTKRTTLALSFSSLHVRYAFTMMLHGEARGGRRGAGREGETKENGKEGWEEGMNR